MVDINFKNTKKSGVVVEILGIRDGTHTISWIPTLEQKSVMLKEFAKELSYDLVQVLPTNAGSVIKYPNSDKLWMLVVSDTVFGTHKWTYGNGFISPELMKPGWEVVHHA